MAGNHNQADNERYTANKMLNFGKRGKSEYPGGKSSWGRAGNQQIQPERSVEYGIQPGQIGGRRAVSSTHFPNDFKCTFE